MSKSSICSRHEFRTRHSSIEKLEENTWFSEVLVVSTRVYKYKRGHVAKLRNLIVYGTRYYGFKTFERFPVAKIKVLGVYTTIFLNTR